MNVKRVIEAGGADSLRDDIELFSKDGVLHSIINLSSMVDAIMDTTRSTKSVSP
jgi:hypothetical protein